MSKSLKHIKPIAIEIPNNQVVINKKTFEAIVTHLNLLTDTVNSLISNQDISEKNIQTLAKSLETIIGG